MIIGLLFEKFKEILGKGRLMMTLPEAIENGIISVDENRELHYNGLCKDCKYSQYRSYPSFSNMCMNKESEWFGCFHVDYDLQRYVDGCGNFERRGARE